MSEVLETPQPELMDATEAPKRSRKAALPARVKLTVQQDGTPGAEKEIFVGVNGVGYRIKRGVEVEVPEEVALVLRDAVKTVYETERSDNGSATMVARNVPVYPFSTRA